VRFSEPLVTSLDITVEHVVRWLVFVDTWLSASAAVKAAVGYLEESKPDSVPRVGIALPTASFELGGQARVEAR
jgi:hypothetical protein